MADLWAPWVRRVSAVYLVTLRHLSSAVGVNGTPTLSPGSPAPRSGCPGACGVSESSLPLSSPCCTYPETLLLRPVGDICTCRPWGLITPVTHLASDPPVCPHLCGPGPSQPSAASVTFPEVAAPEPACRSTRAWLGF